MSREIKFRGQTKLIVGTYNLGKEDGEWVKGFLYDDVGKWVIRQFEYDRTDYIGYEVDPDTVGQYTGVKDKNGKEIYDGDIIKIHQFLFDGCEYEKEIIVSIEYMEDMACFGANLLQAKEIREYMGYNNETDRQEKVVVPLCNFHGLHEQSFEVIGNVYENADLLKESRNER